MRALGAGKPCSAEPHAPAARELAGAYAVDRGLDDAVGGADDVALEVAAEGIRAEIEQLCRARQRKPLRPTDATTGGGLHDRSYAQRVPSPRVANEFEQELMKLASSLVLPTDEPGLGSMQMLLVILRLAAKPGGETATFGHHWLRALHRAYERARADDDNWTNQRRPKRVLRLKRKHVDPDSAVPFELIRLLWPVLPLASFLYYTRSSKSLSHEAKLVRVYEYMFVFLCTKPHKMRAWLYYLAGDVLAPLEHRYPGLDVAQLAGEVVDSLERRPLPVARYKANAEKIEDAATAVRLYMTMAIKRRANDLLRKNVDPSIDVPASTARRWKAKHGITIESPAHVAEIRNRRSEAQRHVPAGRISLAAAAREHLHRARSTVALALGAAEKAHGFVAERGPDGTVWLTKAQLKLVRQHLPPPRARAASMRGGP